MIFHMLAPQTPLTLRQVRQQDDPPYGHPRQAFPSSVFSSPLSWTFSSSSFTSSAVVTLFSGSSSSLSILSTNSFLASRTALYPTLSAASSLVNSSESACTYACTPLFCARREARGTGHGADEWELRSRGPSGKVNDLQSVSNARATSAIAVSACVCLDSESE